MLLVQNRYSISISQWHPPFINSCCVPALSYNFYNFSNLINTVALQYQPLSVHDVTKAHCCSSTGPRLLKAHVFRGKEKREYDNSKLIAKHLNVIFYSNKKTVLKRDLKLILTYFYGTFYFIKIIIYNISSVEESISVLITAFSCKFE